MQAIGTDQLRKPDPILAMDSSSARSFSLKNADNGKQETSKTPSKFVHYARKIYHPLGFKKGYNFILFFIFAGALFGFTLARLPFLNISGDSSSSFKNSVLPSEWYWYSRNPYRFGITLHLSTCLPAALLMILQFIPAIRYKALTFHRINGYAVIILVTLSNIGALMIARRSFGGAIETQAAVGTTAIMVTVSIILAYYNIKKLQIEQHRKWMLRAMFYMGMIITMRLILVSSSMIVAAQETYYGATSCDEIEYGYQLRQANATQAARLFVERYPMCISTDPAATINGHIAVQASMKGGVENVGAAFKMTFGMAAWLALWLHMIGVEVYLSLTPKETERLRKVSYERQLEKGMKNPGSAGLTADHLGDSEPWRPPQ